MFTRRLPFGFVVLASLIAIIAVTMHSNISSATPSPTETVKVAAGGGNATAPWTVFVPQEARIRVGDTVTWYNPTEGVAAEPHTVTFVLDNSTMAGIVSPLAVSNMTEFTAMPPGSNNEPVLVPSKDGMNTLIAVNARTFNPVTIDSQDKVQFMNPDANFSMTGAEKYINSGWILPNGLEGQYPGSGNTFTVTFESPGTYELGVH
jgi:plastocyanin